MSNEIQMENRNENDEGNRSKTSAALSAPSPQPQAASGLSVPVPDAPAHTPTPWRISSANNLAINSGASAETTRGIATTYGNGPGNEYFPGALEAEANAKFIVMACNSHYELRNALAWFVSECDRVEANPDETGIDLRILESMARTAIAQAGVEAAKPVPATEGSRTEPSQHAVPEGNAPNKTNG